MKVSELKSILAKIPDDLNESDVALNIAECKLNKHLGSVSIEHIYGITDTFDNKEIKDKKIVVLKQTPFDLGWID